MLRIARQAKILQIVNEKGFVENEDLAKLFNVTPTTIRKDIKNLAEQKLIRREHGGLFSMDFSSNANEPLYETKVYLNMDKKRAIGSAAANFVNDDDTIILDSGTTNAQIAHYLKRLNLKNIVVITNDLMISKDLCSESNITVIMLGGVLRRSYYSSLGTFTENILRDLTAKKVFLGIDAAHKQNGIFNSVIEEVPAKQLMIQNSEEVFMVNDSSKFGKTALNKVCSWEKIDHVVTDDSISQDYIDFILKNNIKLTIASPTRPFSDE